MRTRIVSFLKLVFQSLIPSSRGWRGGAWALLVATAILWLITGYAVVFVSSLRLTIVLIYLAIPLAAALLGLTIRVVLRLLNRFPPFFANVLWPCVVLLMLFFLSPSPGVTVLIAAGIILASSLVGVGIAMLTGSERPTGWRRAQQYMGTTIGAVALTAGVFYLAGNGKKHEAPPSAAALLPTKIAPLAMPDPSQPGPYKVRTMTYGSGTDLHRPEYAGGVSIKTRPVDGSAFIDRWEGRSGWDRTRYWGFDSKKLPVQGRVWYPEGAGPFPLVLIVHGNHSMEDFSDSGYGYLGELMASRGFIFASLDENFLNYSGGDLLGVPEAGLKEENDARGWMMLEHLRVWKEWNAEADNPFHGKVDMENIALIGHSRGGEAVIVAALFNRLPYYPDNARIKLGYHYGIRGVAAIAPEDGQYKPAGLETPVQNVSYFVLQGAADGDQQSFDGSRVYHRVKFTDKDYHFKATLYINDANHGQFNTNWGAHDQGFDLASRLMNYAQIMPAEDQRRIARVYLSAYLEILLHDKKEYLPLFADHRIAPGWLPPGIYLQQFQDSTAQMVSTYEEDLDVTTTTMPGGSETAESLCEWKEALVKIKMGDMNTSAVFLGWNTREAGIGSYTIRLPETGLKLDAGSMLIFSLADARKEPAVCDPNKKKDADKDKTDKKDEKPIQLSVEVSDGTAKASFPVAVQRQIETHVMKADGLGGMPRFETLFQTYQLPLASFGAVNPAKVKSIRFVFDKSEKGVVILDDVGFREQ
jgi:dienelactone hydrolase